MTTQTKQTILLVSIIPALVAGFATEWSVRAALHTPAGWVPLWVTILTFLLTNIVFRWLVSIIKKNNP